MYNGDELILAGHQMPLPSWFFSSSSSEGHGRDSKMEKFTCIYSHDQTQLLLDKII